MSNLLEKAARQQRYHCVDSELRAIEEAQKDRGVGSEDPEVRRLYREHLELCAGARQTLQALYNAVLLETDTTVLSRSEAGAVLLSKTKTHVGVDFKGMTGDQPMLEAPLIAKFLELLYSNRWTERSGDTQELMTVLLTTIGRLSSLSTKMPSLEHAVLQDGRLEAPLRAR